MRRPLLDSAFDRVLGVTNSNDFIAAVLEAREKYIASKGGNAGPRQVSAPGEVLEAI